MKGTRMASASKNYKVTIYHNFWRWLEAYIEWFIAYLWKGKKNASDSNS
jgi:hypothetical protein